MWGSMDGIFLLVILGALTDAIKLDLDGAGVSGKPFSVGDRKHGFLLQRRILVSNLLVSSTDHAPN
jgi:hypothetical protein